MKNIIQTDNAPKAIGTYSQAVRHGNTLYLSGQIPLDTKTMTLVSDDFKEQAIQVFKNMQAVCEAASGKLDDIVKLTIYITDFANFPIVNEVMATFFTTPYPARTTIEISGLPKSALVEIDAIMALPS